MDHQAITQPFHAIKQQWGKEDAVRFTTDTLRGVYIPKDLEECFVQLDSLLSDSLKAQIKVLSEDEFSTTAHFGLGLQLRNQWQLWGGSRLSKYLYDLNIYHPDHMSNFILRNYHQRLTSKAIDIKTEWPLVHPIQALLELSLENVKTIINQLES